VLMVTLLLSRQLFAIANDEEFARASGMPVLALNLTLAILTATTVVVSMRIVGLLLISALMVVPVATAQLISGSFRMAMAYSLAIGLACAVVGVSASYYTNTPSGGSIVLTAIAVFAVAAIVTGVTRRRPLRRREAASWHTIMHSQYRSDQRVSEERFRISLTPSTSSAALKRFMHDCARQARTSG